MVELVELDMGLVVERNIRPAGSVRIGFEIVKKSCMVSARKKYPRLVVRAFLASCRWAASGAATSALLTSQ